MFRFTHAEHIRTLNHIKTSSRNLSLTQSGVLAAYKFDPLNALRMQDRSRSPAPGRNMADGGGASRRWSQSRASSREMWQQHLNRLPSRPALPVRHESSDWHDTPAHDDPYMEAQAEVHDEGETKRGRKHGRRRLVRRGRDDRSPARTWESRSAMSTSSRRSSQPSQTEGDADASQHRDPPNLLRESRETAGDTDGGSLVLLRRFLQG